MGSAVSPVILRNAVEINLDLDAKVHAAIPQHGCHRSKREIAILLGIAHDNVAAPATHQFVYSHVVKVTAVGEVYIPGIRITQTEQFRRHRRKVEARRRPMVTVRPRIPYPPTKTHVEHGHQKRHRGGRMVSLVRARGRSGYGDCRTEMDAPWIAVSLGRPVCMFCGSGRLVQTHCLVAAFFHVVTGIARGEDEGYTFALLPCQVMAGTDVHRRIHDRVRAEVPAAIAVSRMEFFQEHVVLLVEPREPVGASLSPSCCAEITSHEPVLIELMQREDIDVQTKRKQDHYSQEHRHET